LRTFKKDELKKKEDRPGMKAAIVHGEGLSLSRWELEVGAKLADHSHPHTQITFIISGKMNFRRQGKEPFTAVAGDFIVFEPNEVHGADVIEYTIAMDAFAPAREDFKKELDWKD
jgi:quercetin dioxygenase-like cupin family protein